MIAVVPPSMAARATWTKRLRARWSSLSREVRGEYVMGLNRVAFGLFMLLMASLLGNALSLAKWVLPILAWIAGSVGLLVCLRLMPRMGVVRRCVAIVFDVFGTTTLLIAGGQATAFLYVVYHWIIIGNGFRFGGKYTVAGSIVSIAGFGMVIGSDSFWRDHRSLSIGLLSGLIVLPAYSFVLIRQLTEARRRAERADQAKSLFLASISHELRTPLNAIMGTAELLRGTALDKAQADMVATINTAADGQLSLIQDVLSFSSMEAGQGHVHRVEFDLVALFGTVQAVMTPGARKKGLLLNTYITARTPLLLFGDERRIREVLLNICSNAIKFTPAGSVTLAADGWDFGSGLVRMRFEVTDTGIGIKPEAQARIFELFTQADDTVLDRFGGTGLGLALCERQVTLMSGGIGVDSQPGAGSTFWITLDLPRSPAGENVAPLPARLTVISADQEWEGEAVARLAAVGEPSSEAARVGLVQAGSEVPVPPGTGALIEVVQEPVTGLPPRIVRERFATSVLWGAPDDEWRRAVRIAVCSRVALSESAIEVTPDLAVAPELAGLRVLVADDNGINRSILARMLQQAGIEPVLVGDGEQALATLTEDVIDVALLDVNMPVMNGIDAAKLYRFAALGGRQTPLIALTADATPATQERCLEAGMAACLIKPVRSAELLRTLAGVALAGAERDGPASPSSTGPALVPPLDRATLDALTDLGGPEFVASLITDFERDGSLILGDIEVACMATDLHRFRAAAHSFASISANMGASRVGELCSGWQHIAEPDFNSTCGDLLQQLRGAWSETCIAFERCSRGLRVREGRHAGPV